MRYRFFMQFGCNSIAKITAIAKTDDALFGTIAILCKKSSKMLQDHSLKVRKTCDTCERMSYISLSMLLCSCLGGLFHTSQVQKLKLLRKISQNRLRLRYSSIPWKICDMWYTAVALAQRWSTPSFLFYVVLVWSSSWALFASNNILISPASGITSEHEGQW